MSPRLEKDMTPAQVQLLKTDLAANTATVLINGAGVPVNAVPRGAQNAQTVADWYNQTASPAFWAWHTNSPQVTTGAAIKMGDVGNLTTANSTRLQVSFQIRPNGFNPSAQDDRALFGGLFSVAGAAGTRANLLAAWQFQATNIEKLLATGAGTQATGDLNSDGTVTAGSPAALGFEGLLAGTDVLAAWAS